MSGGGGGDYLPAPPRGPCDRLSTETAVQSPNPEIVGRLSVGQLLTVQLDHRTVFVYLGREIVGTLIFAGLPRLIECIEQGFTFVAEIVQISGPDCRVKVRPQ
jgi:hypothetical protein